MTYAERMYVYTDNAGGNSRYNRMGIFFIINLHGWFSTENDINLSGTWLFQLCMQLQRDIQLSSFLLFNNKIPRHCQITGLTGLNNWINRAK